MLSILAQCGTTKEVQTTNTGVLSPLSVNVSECKLGQIQFERMNEINVLVTMHENHLSN